MQSFSKNHPDRDSTGFIQPIHLLQRKQAWCRRLLAQAFSGFPEADLSVKESDLISADWTFGYPELQLSLFICNCLAKHFPESGTCRGIDSLSCSPERKLGGWKRAAKSSLPYLQYIGITFSEGEEIARELL
jgi:hypothetical protein